MILCWVDSAFVLCAKGPMDFFIRRRRALLCVWVGKWCLGKLFFCFFHRVGIFLTSPSPWGNVQKFYKNVNGGKFKVSEHVTGDLCLLSGAYFTDTFSRSNMLKAFKGFLACPEHFSISGTGNKVEANQNWFLRISIALELNSNHRTYRFSLEHGTPERFIENDCCHWMFQWLFARLSPSTIFPPLIHLDVCLKWLACTELLSPSFVPDHHHWFNSYLLKDYGSHARENCSARSYKGLNVEMVMRGRTKNFSNCVCMGF